MPEANFMLADLGALLLAFLLMGLLFLPLGYVAAWLADPAGFQSEPRALRLMLSVVLGMSISPILCYLMAKAAGFGLVFAAYSAIWCAFALLAGRLRTWTDFAVVSPFENRYQALCCLSLLVWIALAILSLIDLQWAQRLYYAVESHDHGMRSAFTRAITNTGVPPDNPYYRPFHPVPLRYHYGWLLICSAVDQLGGRFIDGRQAVLGSAAWPGIGLICLIPLYFRWIYEVRDGSLWRKSAFGIGLLSVTGLDLAPTALVYFWQHTLAPELEWWNNQVPSWVGALLWVPHHMAALSAVLTGALLVWRARSGTGRARWTPAILAGACFASAGISSIYITLGAAFFCVCWMMVWLRRGWKHELMPLILAGATAAAMGIPYLMELQRGPGGRLVAFAVRRFTLMEWILVVRNLQDSRIADLIYFILLPLNYLLEFGFFFLVGFTYWKTRRWRSSTPAGLFMATLLISSLLLSTFFRSAVLSNNDLGWRVIAFTQFVLIFWSVELIESRMRLGALAIAFLVLGIAGSIYEVGINRFYPVLADAGLVSHWMASDRETGRRTWDQRAVYESIGSRFPDARSIQHNPLIRHDDYPSGLYSPLPVITEGQGCGAALGSDDSACEAILVPLARIFQFPGSMPIEEVRSVGTALGIDLLIVTDLDPAWRQRSSWVWSGQPALAMEHVRLFDLRPGKQTSR